MQKAAIQGIVGENALQAKKVKLILRGLKLPFGDKKPKGFCQKISYLISVPKFGYYVWLNSEHAMFLSLVNLI